LVILLLFYIKIASRATENMANRALLFAYFSIMIRAYKWEYKTIREEIENAKKCTRHYPNDSG
jgi:hypothetical protein